MSRTSTADYYDMDAITPCLDASPTTPVMEMTGIEAARETRSPSPTSSLESSRQLSRRASPNLLEEGTAGDIEQLWNRMLALQQTYRCYNSARMSAALSSGDANLLLPSKTCLDLLNDHMAIPEEAEDTMRKWHINLRDRLKLRNRG